MNNIRSITLLCILFALSACALQQPVTVAPVVVSPPTPAPSVADDMLANLRSLQGMSANELAATRDSARDAFDRDPTAFRRQRYLLALAASSASANEDDRLLVLTEPILAMPGNYDASLVAISFMVQQSTLARKRLRDEIAATRSRIANIASNTKRDERDTEVRALKSRIEELEKQIAALKSIDRSVTRR
jgi:hypothetical protein